MWWTARDTRSPARTDASRVALRPGVCAGGSPGGSPGAVRGQLGGRLIPASAASPPSRSRSCVPRRLPPPRRHLSRDRWAPRGHPCRRRPRPSRPRRCRPRRWGRRTEGVEGHRPRAGGECGDWPVEPRGPRVEAGDGHAPALGTAGWVDAQQSGTGGGGVRAQLEGDQGVAVVDPGSLTVQCPSALAGVVVAQEPHGRGGEGPVPGAPLVEGAGVDQLWSGSESSGFEEAAVDVVVQVADSQGGAA